MRQTSSTYKQLRAAGANYEAKVVLGNKTYYLPDLTALKITQAIFTGNGPEIGKVYSAQCEFSLLEDPSNWPRMAEFTVSVRLTNSVTSSGWLPMGTFYTDTREFDERTGQLHILAFDGAALLETSWSDKVTLPASWPITAQAALNLVIQATNVQIDSRTVLDNTVPFIGLDTTSTARDLLAIIAGGMGGCWVFTPENKLRLVPLANMASGSAAIAGIAIAGISVVGDDTAESIPSGADITDLWIKMASLTVGTPFSPISGVHLETAAGAVADAGDNTGYVLKAICEFSDSAAAGLCLGRVQGITYRPFSASKALLDPAVEIGDLVIIKDIAYQIGSIEWDIKPKITAEIEAPYEAEVDHEYTVVPSEAKTLRKALAADAALNTSLRSYIQQTAREITLGVEQTLEDYSTTTEMNAAISLSATGIMSVVNQEITDLQDQIDGVVDSWYYHGAPTLNNEPAVNWNTQQLKQDHEGDIYTDLDTGYTYRFVNDNGWGWVQIPDTAATQALNTANAVAADLANNYSTTTQMNSAINQSAGQITQTVTETIQTTVVGNLLPHTDDFSGWLTWTNIGGESTVYPDEHEVDIYSDGNGNTSFYVPGFQIKLEPGTTYTLSGKAKKSGDLNYLLFQFYNNNYANPYNYVPTLTTDYAPFKWSFSTASNQTDNDFVFEIVHTGSLTVGDYAEAYVKDLKLEKGAVATDWTPSWGDKTSTSQIISTINQSPEQITINASKLNLQGLVTITSLSTPGSVVIDGGNITAGEINAATINVTNLNASNITQGSMSGGYLTGGTVPSGAIVPSSLGTGQFASGVITSLGYANDANSYFHGWLTASALHVTNFYPTYINGVAVQWRYITVDGFRIRVLAQETSGS